MNTKRAGAALAVALAAAAAAQAQGIQVGNSGKTYASDAIACAMNPVTGMAPQVQAGLYNPRPRARATVSLNGTDVAQVTGHAPDATVWLATGGNTVVVALSRRVADAFAFDASPAFPGQPNVCIPDTRNNSVVGDLEYAASGKSYALVVPGCAMNPLTGQAQPFVNLFDNGAYMLDLSLNGVAITQLDGKTRTKAALFLAPGLNVITAANGALSVDAYVRDGGSGTCALP